MEIPKVSYRIDKSRVVRLLLVVVPFAAVVLGSVAKTYGRVPVWVSALLSVVGALGACFSFYLLRLAFCKKPGLKFDNHGLDDEASFFGFGRVEASDIKKIRLVSLRVLPFVKTIPAIPKLSQPFQTPKAIFLRLKLVSTAQSFKDLPLRKSFCLNIYSLMFGSTFWIPVSFLKLGDMDALREIIRHSREWGETARSTMGNPLQRRRVQLETNVIRLRDDVKKEPADLLKGLVSEESFQPPPTSNEDQPPSLPMTERERVIQTVESLKQSVRDNGLDILLMDLFYDFLRHFPRWKRGNDPRLPETVTKIEPVDGGADPDRVSFRYEDRVFDFALHREGEDIEKARLEVRLDHRVVALFKVRLEIGALDPVDIEKFIKGDWVEDLVSLFALLKSREDPVWALQQQDKAAFGNEGPGTQNDDIDSLKKKFGIS